MKAIDKLKEATKFLKGCSIEAAGKEAEILVKHGLDITTVELYRDNPELNKDQIRTVEDMLRRRLQYEPLQYITGYEEFLGMKLMVGSGVLIPRPETEFMAEQAIKAVKRETLGVNRNFKKTNTHNSQLSIHDSQFTVLDICTGCGCLALSIAKEFPDVQVYGTDISEIALEYAKKNAEINGIKNVTFLKGNLFEPIERLFTPLERKPCPGFLTGFTADLIISNPPYIKTKDIENLQPEIKDWEPEVAINGGPDGMDFYRELIPSARRFLKDGGLIMLELGAGQSSNAADLIESAGYSETRILKDYIGIERVIQAKWKR